MSTTERISISADEVNCLIHSYFRDSGFTHSAFTLHSEAQLHLSPHINQHIPRGELIELLSKALLYIETEKHWKDNFACKSGFSLLGPHVCDQELQNPNATPINHPPDQGTEHPPQNQNTEGVAPKRKASTSSTNDVRSEKRAKTEQDDTDASASESSKTKSTENKPLDTAIVVVGTTDDANDNAPQIPPSKESDPSAIQLLTGHVSEVFVCAWNPTKPELLATGSKDATVNIWTRPISKGDSTHSTNGVLSLRGHFDQNQQGDLTSIDWNHDGSLLAMGSYDSVLRVCNSSGDLYMMKGLHKGPIFATRFSANGRWLLTASLDHTVCLWDVREKALSRQYHCHADCCLDVDWIDENTFASCGADSQIHIMWLHEAKPIRTLRGHTNEINQIKSNSSKTRLASCSDDQTARIWNIADITAHHPDSTFCVNDIIVLKGHGHSVSSIAWCPQPPRGSGEIVATSSFDSTSRLWDAETGACLKIFSDHKRPVYALSFSPNGFWLSTGSGDGYLHVYNVRVRDRKKSWSWYAGCDKPGVFEIDWQMTKQTNRIALALECRRVCIIDVTKISALRELPSLWLE